LPPAGSTRSSNIGPAAGIALFVIAVTAVRPRPLYPLHARRAGRLSDSPNPRAVLTYAEPGTSPAPRGFFLFCGGVLRASILVVSGSQRLQSNRLFMSTRPTLLACWAAICTAPLSRNCSTLREVLV